MDRLGRRLWLAWRWLTWAGLFGSPGPDDLPGAPTSPEELDKARATSRVCGPKLGSRADETLGWEEAPGPHAAAKILPHRKQRSRADKTSLPIKNSLRVYAKRLLVKMLLELTRPPLLFYPSFFVRRHRELELLLSKHWLPPLRSDIVKSSGFVYVKQHF